MSQTSGTAAPKDALAPAPTPELTIDVLNDLESGSSLAGLLVNSRNAIFSIAREIGKFKDQSISAAAAANVSAQLTLNADNSWAIPNTPITLSLTAAASGTITISKASETFAVTTTIDSSDTTNLIATPPSAGAVYVNIDLSFSIQGSVAVSGNINAVGIAGSVSDGHTATLTFCQPVDGTLNTVDAIKLAFSQIVFPLDPAGILNMQTGALSRAIFDGTFNASVTATYGLGDHTFAAPGVVSALNSAQNVVSLTPPSLDINAGVSGTVSYTHTDHFALVLNKSTATIATVYLIRMLGNDVGLSTGITVGITPTNVSVAVDPTALTALVQKVTGTSALANEIASAASSGANSLTSSLNSRLAAWAAKASEEIGLTAGLDRQTNRTTLFVFDADLTSPALTTASWKALVSGDLATALTDGGLKLQPGSGVSESLKRSATVQFQFFNLFAFSSTDAFFSKASAELSPDGTIRLRAAIGDESDNNVNKALSTMRVYFVVGATSDVAGNITKTDVDLRIELIEANRPGSGATYEETLALLPQSSDITAAQSAIGTFLAGGRASKFVLIYDIKSTAYSKLTASPFTGNNPAPLPQNEDRANWTAFRDASLALKVPPNSVANLTFDNWVNFNQAENGIDVEDPPNRREVGAGNNFLYALPTDNQLASVVFFLNATQGFMNLCDDLRVLRNDAIATNDTTAYNELLSFLASIIKQDIPSGYFVPTAGALVRQCIVAGTSIAINIDKATDNTALTCTVTLS